jgi:hypothetical protein
MTLPPPCFPVILENAELFRAPRLPAAFVPSHPVRNLRCPGRGCQVLTQRQRTDLLDHGATLRIPAAQPVELKGIQPGFWAIPYAVTPHTLIGPGSLSTLWHASSRWSDRSTTSRQALLPLRCYQPALFLFLAGLLLKSIADSLLRVGLSVVCSPHEVPGPRIGTLAAPGSRSLPLAWASLVQREHCRNPPVWPSPRRSGTARTPRGRGRRRISGTSVTALILVTGQGATPYA